jgi:hypothetical protein
VGETGYEEILYRSQTKPTINLTNSPKIELTRMAAHVISKVVRMDYLIALS